MAETEDFDPVEVISEGIVDWLNRQDDWEKPPVARFQAELEDNPVERLSVLDDSLKVYVTPYNEAAEKAGREGVAVEGYGVMTMVVVTLEEDGNRKRKNMSLLERQIALQIRRLPIKRPDCAGNYVWENDEMERKYDPAIFREKGQFVAARVHTFSGMSS